MNQKFQWFLRLAGFITIGISIFAGKHSTLLGALGGVMFLLGMLKFKKKR